MSGFNHLNINRLVVDYQKSNKKSTILDISKLIGISKSTLDNARKGVKNPTIDVLYKIAVFFGVTVNSFIDDMKMIDGDAPVVSAPLENYALRPIALDDVDPWRVAYELQKENAALELEIERLKKAYATGRNANAG